MSLNFSLQPLLKLSQRLLIVNYDLFVKDDYEIWRFMIDKRYQGRGCGREALKPAPDLIRTWPCGKAEFCWISYEPENKMARKLYTSLGFEETDEMDGDEIVAVLKL